jgi:hypothetical protein
MSVKAGFKTASKILRCSQCKKFIDVGERYFEANAPFSKTVTNCVVCVKKSGIFTDEDIQTDKTVKATKELVRSTLSTLSNIQVKAKNFDDWLLKRHPEEYEYAQKWKVNQLEKLKNPSYFKRIIELTEEMIVEG